ncbi:MAG: transcriptional regulator GcvA [Myxococcota bacterium]
MATLPLNALWAFEVAARHGSYTKAAEELRLTHSAISHQMRLLEEDLGRPLFVREGRRMKLTAVGEALAKEAQGAFASLSQAYERAHRHQKPSVITVSVLPSFASRWLVPRLSRFYALHPSLDVSLRVSDDLANFKTDGVDLGLRFGGGSWPGLTAIELLREEVFPVSTVAYRRAQRLQRPADLARATLLRNTNQPWVPWFRSVGLDWSEPSRGTLYDDSLTALRAAGEGHGVALARSVLVSEDIEAGRLCRLFPGAVPVDWAYYAVYLGDGAPPEHVVPFLDWLKSEAAGASRGRPAPRARRSRAARA